MTIRKFAIEDWKMLRALRLEALQDSPQAFGSNYQREAARSDDEWLDRYMMAVGDHPSTIYMIAIEDGKAVGMAGAYTKGEGLWCVVAVYTSPAFRGQGVSTQILKDLVSAVKEQPEAKALELQVNVSQVAAVSLYKRVGFEIIKILKDQELGDGKKYDEYLMRMDLGKGDPV